MCTVPTRGENKSVCTVPTRRGKGPVCTVSGYIHLSSVIKCSSSAGFNKQSALLTSIQELLLKGTIQVEHTPDSLGFYSRVFQLPKPGNHWRPVIDLSSLNKFLDIPKFKMETPESIHTSLMKGEWVLFIDLTDAYLHVPIHSQPKKYLRFYFKGVTYQFTIIPFNLAMA